MTARKAQALLASSAQWDFTRALNEYMPRPKLNRDSIRRYLQTFQFSDLFIECGWNFPNSKAPHAYVVKDQTFTTSPVAELSGYRVFEVTSPDGVIPDATTQNTVWKQVARHSAENILIFVNASRSATVWLWMRRDLGTEKGKATKLRPRRHAFMKGHSGDLFISKLSALVVAIDELDENGNFPITEAANRVAKALDVERLTRKFYNDFDVQRKAFIGLIKGITDLGDREWYCSVMLNRLMFVFFIQQKGFLDGDYDYLRARLNRCKKENGKDQFYSFYRYFLLRLFHEGFGKRKKDRSPDLEKLLGNIPYLNGGLFDVHELELPDRYGEGIQIPDKAFERIFDCFDEYDWVLDPERTVKKPGDKEEINPDVLGYIFEKYINQKQMGAYYTKEDITEYIGKGTVLPFILDSAKKNCATAFSRSGPNVWELLRESPDSYIYPAVWHGTDAQLPPDIAAGLEITKPNLAERRKSWDRPGPAELALPTETWREVVARRHHYAKVRKKLVAGEVRNVSDFLTLNLDLLQFTRDIIQNCEGPDLLMAFWQAITQITILDPTGGSGAFIFAALNLLETLYEDCLDRMEGFLAEWGDEGKKLHPQHYKKFSEVLCRIEEHSNRNYFVLKSIILNNLYAVDIMEEAVEICKLRLFLKLASQVEPDSDEDNLGIEPLPDIDFNIRAGNSLVGYATKAEVNRCMKEAVGGQLKLLGDAELGTFDTFNRRCADVEEAFTMFRVRQTYKGGSVAQADKIELQKRLKILDAELNLHLASEYGIRTSDTAVYAKWIKDHQPFHWFVHFFGVLSNGGFDVIIGNPPYVEVPKEFNRSLLRATFSTALENWSRDEDLFTFVVERSLVLLRAGSGRFGMILPLSIAFSTKRPFVKMRGVMAQERGQWYLSHFDRIPSALFGNEVRTRCTISLLSRDSDRSDAAMSTTSLLRWNVDFRDELFQTISYATLALDFEVGIPKVATQVQADGLKHMLDLKAPLGLDLKTSIPFKELERIAPNFPQPCVYVGGTAYNWFPAWRDIPKTTNTFQKPSLPARTSGFIFRSEEDANIVFALLCSSLGYWWWAVASDGFNLKKWLLDRFPISIAVIPKDKRKPLAQLGAALSKTLKQNYVFKDNRGRIGNFFLPACIKETQAIDAFLATSIRGLSPAFFDEIQHFNAGFSRAEVAVNEDEFED